jgi:uncharacterized membrane protein
MRVHYKLLTEPGYVSACDVSSTINCSAAYLSAYGSIFGVPVALAGAAWFALVALIAAFAAGPPPVTRQPAATPPSRPATTYIFGLAAVGLAAILYLAYASVFVLGTYCLLCMGTYACVIGIFITSAAAKSTPLSQAPGLAVGDLSAVIKRPATRTAALIYAAVVVLALIGFPREMSSAPPAAPAVVTATQEAQFTEWWARQPRVDFGIDPGTAKVVVVKFNDWLCPGCKALEELYDPVIAKYEREQPGAVKYVYKDLPWNMQCNATIRQTLRGHEGACDAAVAVRLARDAGEESAMVDWLFANQQLLAQQGMAGGGAASRSIRAKTEELLGVTDFDGELAARMPEIQRDVAEAVELQVASTPTYFVNGVRTTSVRTQTDPGGQNPPPEYIDLAIKIELAASGGSR